MIIIISNEHNTLLISFMHFTKNVYLLMERRFIVLDFFFCRVSTGKHAGSMTPEVLFSGVYNNNIHTSIIHAFIRYRFRVKGTLFFCISYSKTLKRRVLSFWEFYAQESKEEVIKIVSPIKMTEILQKIFTFSGDDCRFSKIYVIIIIRLEFFGKRIPPDIPLLTHFKRHNS